MIYVSIEYLIYFIFVCIHVQLHDKGGANNDVGKCDLCQHRLSMSAYMSSNVGIGDLCQHRISMSTYMFNNIGIGDLCQHRC